MDISSILLATIALSRSPAIQQAGNVLLSETVGRFTRILDKYTDQHHALRDAIEGTKLQTDLANAQSQLGQANANKQFTLLQASQSLLALTSPEVLKSHNIPPDAPARIQDALRSIHAPNISDKGQIRQAIKNKFTLKQWKEFLVDYYPSVHHELDGSEKEFGGWIIDTIAHADTAGGGLSLLVAALETERPGILPKS